MGLGSRYLRVAGRHREEAAPVVGFRFRYPRAVEYGGSGRAARVIGLNRGPDFGSAAWGARPHRWHDDCRLARAFAVKPAHRKRCAPAGVGA